MNGQLLNRMIRIIVKMTTSRRNIRRSRSTTRVVVVVVVVVIDIVDSPLIVLGIQQTTL
jgi:hypothetical protein